MAVSKWGLLGKEILMAYISNCMNHFWIGFPKKEILKKENFHIWKVIPTVVFLKTEILVAYLSNPETILGRNFQKRKFDGLCKQVM